MKKLIYLIVLALILGLALTGCLLSNVGQAPATGQSGISYLTKSPDSMTVVSDTNTMVTEINNIDVADQDAVLCWVHPGWFSGLTWKGWSGAQWIWDTYESDDPIQSPSASITGRVVRFERTFNISGTPTAGTLHIAVDNGYEVWLNGQFVGTDNVWPLPPGDLSWRTSNLKQEHVDWTNWQTVGNYNVIGLLQSGTNTLMIIAGNEYMYTDDTQPSGTSWPRTGGSAEPVGNKSNNPGGVVFQLDIDYEVVIEEAPGIAIEKSGPATAHEGDIITYTYTVTNAGDVPLSAVAVSDDLAGAAVYVSGDTNTDGFLDLDETWIFTANYDVPPVVDPVMNTANVFGTSPQDTQVTDDDDWSVDILNPAISVVKSADTEVAAPGDTVTYSYTVTNTGDCILYDVSLVDDVVGTITLTGLTDEDSDGFSDDLAVDATATGTADYEVTIDDPEWLVNNATASGTDELGLTVDDEASWTFHTMCARTIGYWKNHLDWCSLPEESIFYEVDKTTLLTYLPGSGAEVNGMNPLEMLRAQLLAAELNVACFDDEFDYSRYDAVNIYDTIHNAEEFLDDFPDDLNTYWSGLGKAGQRAFRIAHADSLALKDVLDTFNNMGDECF